MKTILIIFCNCNKIITYETKQITILANVSCTIETIRILNPVCVSFTKKQITLKIFTFEFHFFISIFKCYFFIYLTYKIIDCCFFAMSLVIFKMEILATGLQGELVKFIYCHAEKIE